MAKSANKLKNFEHQGFVIAPLYYEFVKWVDKEEAKYADNNPIFASMRSGEPILTAAEELLWLGVRKKSKGAKIWRPLWVNRNVSKLLHTPNVEKYLVLEGIEKNKPFTMLDSGYFGTIPGEFAERGYKLRSLNIAIQNQTDDLCDGIELRGFLNESGDEGRGLMSMEIFCDDKIVGPHVEMCASFIEQIPHLHQVYGPFYRSGDGAGPILSKCTGKQLAQHQHFQTGFKEGINLCAASDKRACKGRLEDYLGVIRASAKICDFPGKIEGCCDAVREIYS